jgi:hypothetical protein
MSAFRVGAHVPCPLLGANHWWPRTAPRACVRYVRLPCWRPHRRFRCRPHPAQRRRVGLTDPQPWPPCAFARPRPRARSSKPAAPPTSRRHRPAPACPPAVLAPVQSRPVAAAASPSPTSRQRGSTACSSVAAARLRSRSALSVSRSSDRASTSRPGACMSACRVGPRPAATGGHRSSPGAGVSAALARRLIRHPRPHDPGAARRFPSAAPATVRRRSGPAPPCPPAVLAGTRPPPKTLVTGQVPAHRHHPSAPACPISVLAQPSAPGTFRAIPAADCRAPLLRRHVGSACWHVPGPAAPRAHRRRRRRVGSAG